MLCKKFSSKIVFETSEEWIFKTIFFFFLIKERQGSHIRIQKKTGWETLAYINNNYKVSRDEMQLPSQSHRIENTTFDFENRHNKSRHLSEIILPFTFKLNRHQEEYRFEQVSSKK